ncbi:MAG: orotidine-5'-phosphate decarboxylase [Gammaproteobacteria bacterium]|nr:orotidine-5'-phosphate decarboxylase [Gammaproteobacteria bacterium]
MRCESKIIVALDFPAADAALNLAAQIDPSRCRLKVGKELFTRAGPALVESLQRLGFDIFLDLKYHDIPNTVAAACRAAADLGVWMVNVHALGGQRMMAAAAEALAGVSQPPLLIAVTILTSMDDAELSLIGLQPPAAARVQALAELAAAAGVAGVVCSPKEITLLRQHLPDHFLLVTPGIRPLWSASDDQKRIKTPAAAIRDGSNYLVIGRPITAADNPMSALELIEAEIAAAPSTSE